MLRLLGSAIVVWIATGCGEPQKAAYIKQRHALTIALHKIDNEIDISESKRLASRILQRSKTLTQKFERSLSPVFHNFLVDMHLKKGGLCWHYADAIYLDLLRHQAIFPHYRFHLVVAHKGEYFREHNTVLVVAKDKPLNKGLVIDAWRDNKRLVFYPFYKDPDYRWEHRKDRCLCEIRN